MHVMTLFYLLVGATFLIAYARLKVLDVRRARAARRLGASRGTVVIPLVHRVETVTLLGLPLYRYVTVPLAEEVVTALSRIPAERPVDLLVHLPDGLALDVTAMTEAVSGHAGTVTLIVPACALSGSGALTEVADAVIAGPEAVLSPPGDGAFAGAPRDAAGATVPDGAWRLLALYEQPPRRRGSPLFLPLSGAGRVALPRS